MTKLEEKLLDNLEMVSRQYPGVMGIGAKSLDSDAESILINGDEVFCIGSSIKIPILI